MIINAQLKTRMSQDGLNFRREDQLLIVRVIVEWLLADSVASQNEGLLVLVPNRKGKHTAELRHKLVWILLVEMNDGLCIGTGAELVVVLQLLVEFLVVIDLAVEGDPDSSVF